MKPNLLWSTYPIPTAHLLGYALHRLTGIPLVIDLRDPMAQEDYRSNPLQWRAIKWIQEGIARWASAICFTSPGAIVHFLKKHSHIVEPRKLFLIENGYDEDAFLQAENNAKSRPSSPSRPLALVHSGVVYPSGRDPQGCFQEQLYIKQAGLINSLSLRIAFRATGHDNYLAGCIQSAGREDIILCLKIMSMASTPPAMISTLMETDLKEIRQNCWANIIIFL